MPYIQELENKIRLAKAAYYRDGTSPVEDAVFDGWENELRALDPENPVLKEIGSSDGMLAKTKHAIPMGSLNKAMNRAELESWLRSMPASSYFLTYKMDGGSVSLQYENGKLIRAVTRGDGIEGDDITHNAIHFYGVPKKGVKFNDVLFSGYIRGELILTNDKWKLVDPEQTSNPRNLGVGIARRKSDQSEAQHLTVYAFRAHFEDGTEIAHRESDMTSVLMDGGFTVPPSAVALGLEGMWSFVTQTEQNRSLLNYWIDGIVVSINDIHEQRKFEVDAKPKWSVAVKFAPRTHTTILRSVEFNVGHTGAIIPVGKFDPVIIDGTEVKSALLCNWDIINAHDLAIGDTVDIYKAGDIIPRVLRVTHRPADRIAIAEPTHCPICGSPVARRKGVNGDESAAIFCDNDDCGAKTFGHIKRFVKSIDIMWLGDEVIKALIHYNARIDGLYRLTVEDLTDLQLESGRTLGKTSAKKIIAEIDKKRELTLPQLLGSVGIDSLGKGRVENIMEAVPGEMDTLEDWTSGKLIDQPGLAKRAGVPGLGEVIQKSLNKKLNLLERIISAGVRVVAPVKKAEIASNAKSFCLTGTLSKGRNDIVKDIEAAGHVYIPAVKAGLDYLVMADPDSGSAKAKNAAKHGVKCISEKELYDIISA